jgi:phage repressor protein C with HTH and peptisase S24 domain
MKTSIGATISELRKGKNLMQRELAAGLDAYGFKVSPKTIYNWEKGLAQPSIPHFIALCDILDVDDVLWRFAGIQKGPYAGLNADGRKKVSEFISLLHHIDIFKTTKDDMATAKGFAVEDGLTANDGFSVADAPGNPEVQHESEMPRILRLYDIPVSAGTGNFLDESSFEEIEAPSYVPVAVDFALRVTGNSMDPLIQDGQVIWVKEQDVLDSGDIGIFSYSGDVYCKKLIANGAKAYLRSLNPEYEDIEIREDFGFKTIGKVV